MTDQTKPSGAEMWRFKGSIYDAIADKFLQTTDKKLDQAACNGGQGTINNRAAEITHAELKKAPVPDGQLLGVKAIGEQLKQYDPMEGSASLEVGIAHAVSGQLSTKCNER